MSAIDNLKSRIHYEPAIHRGKAVIFIRFGNEKRLNERVKKLVGVRWSATKKAWYVPDIPIYRHRFSLDLVLAGKDVLSQIATVNQPHCNDTWKHFSLKLIVKAPCAHTAMSLLSYCIY